MRPPVKASRRFFRGRWAFTSRHPRFRICQSSHCGETCRLDSCFCLKTALVIARLGGAFSFPRQTTAVQLLILAVIGKATAQTPGMTECVAHLGLGRFSISADAAQCMLVYMTGSLSCLGHPRPCKRETTAHWSERPESFCDGAENRSTLPARYAKRTDVMAG